MFPHSLPPWALVLYNVEVRRAFSSYWWVTDCLWGGPLPERWEVSTLFTRERVILPFLWLGLCQGFISRLLGKPHPPKMGILGGEGRGGGGGDNKDCIGLGKALWYVEQAPHFCTYSPSVNSGLAPARFQGCQRDELCSAV